MKSYFIWKGISSLDKNIIIKKLPNIERAGANIEKIIIPGRDGFLTKDYGNYNGTVKECECYLDNGNINDLCSWLTGSSKIIFSNEPDKKYKAVIVNSIPLTQVIPTFHNFIIRFECQPYKYELNNDIIKIIKNNSQIYNIYSSSLPIIKIYGTGNITININSKNIILKNIIDYVVIDSEMVDCYKDTTLKNNDMYGEFPTLDPGENIISWVGNVTKLEITPNWRCL